MKASTQRKIFRWLHILLSIPVVGFIYGPVAQFPEAAFAVRVVFLPVVVLSGFWMWKGQPLKKWIKKKFQKSKLKKLQGSVWTIY